MANDMGFYEEGYRVGFQDAGHELHALNSRIAALEAENAGLKEDAVAREEEFDALSAKIDALAPHGTCGCSYDKPGDLCMHHSPKLVALEAENADMVRALTELMERANAMTSAIQSRLADAEAALREIQTLGDASEMPLAHACARAARAYFASAAILALPQSAGAETETGDKRTWRCFHCDEVFTTPESAREHFGASENASAACQINIAEYRRLEEQQAKCSAECCDEAKRYFAAEDDRRRALVLEEQKGYDKGLRDARAELAPSAIPEAARAETVDTLPRTVRATLVPAMDFRDRELSPYARERIDAAVRAERDWRLAFVKYSQHLGMCAYMSGHDCNCGVEELRSRATAAEKEEGT